MPIAKIFYTAAAFFLLCSMSLLTTNAISNGLSEDAAIEPVVRKLLYDIHNKDFEKILQMIPDDGVMDGDTLISKKKIAEDIKDKNSYLYKHLFKEVTADELKLCTEKLGGRLIVSPNAFYEYFGENYAVHVTPILAGDWSFGVKVAGNEPFKNDSCEYELWHFVIHKVNNSYFLGTYFFQ